MEKLINNFNGIYKITDTGSVYSKYKYKTGKVHNSWRLVTPIIDKHVGYYIVSLCKNKTKKNYFIHRLLAEHFIKNPKNKLYVNHIDGNKLNNNLSNLEWCTSKENSIHAWKIGLSKPNNEVAILQFDKNNNFIKEYKSLHEAGRQTNICWQNIYKVCNNIRKSAGNYLWKYK